MALRTAIVGCGAVAQRLYRKPLQRLAKQRILEVVALVDPAEKHAAALRPSFKSARVFSDLEQGLSATRPELTLILTPAHLHASQTLLAIAHDSHVLCEKPMASSAAECARMNAAARASKRVLAVGMIRRFFPAFAEMRSLVQSGELGVLRAFEYREGHKFEWAVTTAAAFRPRRDGGAGVLFDIGTHALDYLQSVFGTLRVTSYADDAMAGVESTVNMSVEAAHVRGTVDLAWDVPQSNQLRVIGSRAEAVLRLDRFDQVAVDSGEGFKTRVMQTSFPADVKGASSQRITPLSYPEAIYSQLIQLLRAILLGEQPAVDGEEGERCIGLIEQALAVAAPISEPWLDPALQSLHRKLHWTSMVNA